MDEPVTIVEYDSDWPGMYEAEKALILDRMGELIVSIEHIGSTSIVGLDAKPVIDIMAAVRDIEEVEFRTETLERIGYELVSGVFPQGRLFFVKSTDGVRSHHLHLVPLDGFRDRNEIVLRDYLRPRPELAREYARLKRELAASHASDQRGYTKSKTEFIQKTVDQARIEKGLPPVDVWEE